MAVHTGELTGQIRNWALLWAKSENPSEKWLLKVNCCRQMKWRNVLENTKCWKHLQSTYNGPICPLTLLGIWWVLPGLCGAWVIISYFDKHKTECLFIQTNPKLLQVMWIYLIVIQLHCDQSALSLHQFWISGGSEFGSRTSIDTDWWFHKN